MSGIVGFVQEGNHTVLNTLISKMSETIRHRGRYGAVVINSNSFYSSCVASDSKIESKSTNADGFRYILHLDGFITNIDTLKHLLKIDSDDAITVLTHAYLHWEEKLFEKLEGKFAIVIYDGKNQKVILVRDIFGQKPLYYSQKKDFSFSSELNAFKVLNPDLKLSVQSVNEFLSIGYTLAPDTIYEDVYIVPPASLLSFDINKKQISIQEYHPLENYYLHKNKDSYQDIVHNTSILLKEATQKLLLQSDTSGIFLSSGIDSCGILSMINEEERKNIQSYTISFGQSEYDESQIVRKLLEQIDIPHQFIDMSEISRKDFDNYLKKIDYLTFDNSSYPITQLASLAIQNVDFVLTGDGGDELFGGYITYQADKINRKIKLFIPLFKSIKLSKALDFFNPKNNDKVGLWTKGSRFIKGLDTDYKRAHYNWRLLFSAEERIALMGETYREFIYDTDPFYKFRKIYDGVNELEVAEQHYFADIKTWFSDNNLIKLDRSTMLHSLETSTPFLDKHLFQYVASCPIKYKQNKQILKDVLKAYTPNYILKKKKSGFNSPVHQWFDTHENEFEFYTKLLYKKKYFLH